VPTIKHSARESAHATALAYFRYRRHSGHGRTCCRFDPVVNDPKLTFTMPSLLKYSVRHEESVCNSRAAHSRRLRRSSFRSEAGLCRSTVRRMPMNSNAATGQWNQIRCRPVKTLI